MKSKLAIIITMVFVLSNLVFVCNVSAKTDLRSMIYNTLQKKKNTEFSNYVYVDINKLTDAIYVELENDAGIRKNPKTRTVEKKVVDYVTKKAGITGLVQFVDRSNAILDSNWVKIYNDLEPLGYKSKKTDPIKVSLNFAIKAKTIKKTKFKLRKGNASISSYATNSSRKTTSYTIRIYKADFWNRNIFDDNTSTYKKYKESFYVPEDGDYYVIVSKKPDKNSISGSISIKQN